MGVRILCVLMLLGWVSPALGVILAARAERNVRVPRGTLAGSGWQWQGQWGDFLGTPIQKRFFITAGHVGGFIGQPFVYRGVSYDTIATYNDPDSDLQIWEVDEDFPDWAITYKRGEEAGRGVMLFGRGTTRGEEVVVSNELKGWFWGEDDHAQSWGKNVVGGLASSTTDAGDKIAGTRFYWTFDRNGVGHEGTVSAGDSGGGVFIFDRGRWLLAGINHSAEAAFSLPGESDIRKGAIFDAGGLMSGDSLIPDQIVDLPTKAYATRISARIPWIADVLRGEVLPTEAVPGDGVPEPSGVWGLVILSIFTRFRPFRR